MATNTELEAILASLWANPYSPDQTLEELRGTQLIPAATALPLPEGTSYVEVEAGNVPSEWIDAPNVATDSIFLFIHGGGYYRGSVAESRPTAAHISAASGMRCLSIDYRLAPEHPFPAAVEDAYIAYMWLIEQAISPARIIIGGISAGGGLTMALLFKLKSQGDPLPAGATPLSAWTDLMQTGQSIHSKADIDPLISKVYLDRMAGQYLRGADPTNPLASPLFGDLVGLPRLLIQVGSTEVLLDDSARLAKRAKAAGVDVTYEVWEDMFHAWHGCSHILTEAKEAIQNIGKFCTETLSIS